MKKKILGWLGSAPLLRFNLLIEFENDIKIPLSDGKKISECVEDYYQNEPNLYMCRQNQISLPKKIGHGLNYSDKDGNNLFTIGKNFLQFQFKKYPNWNKILTQVSDILFKLKEEL